MAQTFNTEEKCRDHLTKIRWVNGVVCPHCGRYGRINQLKSRPLWWCGDCKKQFSVKVGTIFEGSPISLQKWFMAVWLLTNHEKGISPYQLAKDIAVTQKTAGFMLSRLREAMSEIGRENNLPEKAKIEDGYIDRKVAIRGTEECAKRTRRREKVKTIRAPRRSRKRSGEISAYKVPDLKGKTIRVVVSSNVVPSSHIIPERLADA